MSVVTDNIMNQAGYTPYCGGQDCKLMPRTFWNGKQFECPHCKWQSAFDNKFVDEYKSKWGKP